MQVRPIKCQMKAACNAGEKTPESGDIKPNSDIKTKSEANPETEAKPADK